MKRYVYPIFVDLDSIISCFNVMFMAVVSNLFITAFSDFLHNFYL